VRDAFGGGKVDITRFKALGEMQSVHPARNHDGSDQANARFARDLDV
jgi:hypothetical protein